MRVEVNPFENVRTNMPITVKISDETTLPSLEVTDLGMVPVRKDGKDFVGEFWSQKEGKYQIVVRGKDSIWRSSIKIDNQKFITFNQEMTVFSILILVAAIGLILWMKKIKKI